MREYTSSAHKYPYYFDDRIAINDRLSVRYIKKFTLTYKSALCILRASKNFLNLTKQVVITFILKVVQRGLGRHLVNVNYSFIKDTPIRQIII